MTAIRYLKPLTISVYATIALGLLCWTNLAMAQDAPPIYQPNPDSPIGERNPNGPPELARYDFLIGDWDLVVTNTTPAGETRVNKAKWHNIWIGKGYVVQQVWRSAYTIGNEFRSYDAKQGKWVGQNIYFNSNWRATEIEFVDGNMIVYNPHAEDQNGIFTNRETYYDITENSFKIKSDRSDDGGESWRPGRYVIEATRVTE